MSEWITLSEAAERYFVSRTTLDRRIKINELSVSTEEKLGKQVKTVKVSELETKFVSRQEDSSNLNQETSILNKHPLAMAMTAGIAGAVAAKLVEYFIDFLANAVGRSDKTDIETLILEFDEKHSGDTAKQNFDRVLNSRQNVKGMAERFEKEIREITAKLAETEKEREQSNLKKILKEAWIEPTFFLRTLNGDPFIQEVSMKSATNSLRLDGIARAGDVRLRFSGQIDSTGLVGSYWLANQLFVLKKPFDANIQIDGKSLTHVFQFVDFQGKQSLFLKFHRGQFDPETKRIIGLFWVQ